MFGTNIHSNLDLNTFTSALLEIWVAGNLAFNSALPIEMANEWPPFLIAADQRIKCLPPLPWLPARQAKGRSIAPMPGSPRGERASFDWMTVQWDALIQARGRPLETIIHRFRDNETEAAVSPAINESFIL